MDHQQKIQNILNVSGLSQEALARKLDVSFATLNSWVNRKSKPTRAESLKKIDALYVTYFGEFEIDEAKLTKAKSEALQNKMTAKDLRENRDLLDKITLNLTYHTNTIEGSTMTKNDVAEVLFDNKVLKNRTAVEQREAVNHRAALFFLIDELADDSRPFLWTLDLIKSVHLRLMNGIISDAGYFRNHAVRIVGAAVPLANFIKITDKVSSLCRKLNEPHADALRILAETHAEFEQIHPFSDGNRRTGRLIMFAKSLQFGILPPIVEKERKSAYYRYLEFAQIHGKFDNLELLLAESILNLSLP
ncbi:MAG: Fic family protein [Planctomycetota bacterium]|jgi:Fic family protein|nr:Fic family protein [Planctomycetota bacterium]